MRNFALVEEFRYLGYVMTADCRDDKDIEKNNSGGKMQLATCGSGNSQLHLYIEAQMQLFKSCCYPIYGCDRKLTDDNSDTFKRLSNVPRYTSSNLAFAMNATDHINVVFRKFVDSLMSRVSPTVLLLPLSIVMHIISLHWWISGRVCYMYRNNHR